MDNSGEVADLMVKESIQLTEAAVKMLAAGSKNLAAFLLALSQNNKKLYGKANMARLLQTGPGTQDISYQRERPGGLPGLRQEKCAVLRD